MSNHAKRGTSTYFKGVFASVCLVDGTAYAATDFGETDSNDVWRPKDISGLTFGTNGFHLDFADSADLGNDVSGNGNDWALNSITSANATDDTATDPYACLNAITPHSATLGDQNLTGYGSNSEQVITSTISLPSTGKWAFKATKVADASGDGSGSRWTAVGICEGSYPGTLAFNSSFAHMLSDSGWLIDAGTHTDEGAQIDDADTVEVLFDADAGTVLFKHNGSNHHTAKTHSLSGDLYFAYSSYSSTRTFVLDFGQNGYSPSDSNYKTLMANNLPEPTIKKGSDHFDAILWTGTGSSNARSGVDFQPDLALVKKRNASASHVLVDAVRGTSKGLAPDDASAENTDDNVTAFNSDGITLGTHTEVNNSGDTYVGWLWRVDGAGSSNSDGSITSTVSANIDAGISIFKYTGNATDNATIGHGLDEAPELVIVKRIDGGTSWYVGSSKFSSGAHGMYLDLSNGAASDSSFKAYPSSTVITVGPAGYGTNNSSAEYIGLAFHSVEGFSKIFSYTGNNSSDGPAVWLGFKAAFVLLKRTDSTGSWYLFDVARNTFNEVTTVLNPHLPDAEATVGGVDFTSGFMRIRTTNSQINASGANMIGMAFAEHPFGGENTTPALAA